MQKIKKIRAILFDIDGTLLDTKELIYQSFEYTFQFYNLVVPKREEFIPVIGFDLEACYRYFCPGKNIEKMCEIHRDFQVEHLSLSKLFLNTVKTLEYFIVHGFKIAAITNRSNKTALKNLQLANIAKYFDVVITANDVQHHKPHPEALLKALEILKIEPGQAVMVGDTDSDIQAGKNANVLTIGVTYGFQGEKIRDAHPDFVVDDILEVTSLIS